MQLLTKKFTIEQYHQMGESNIFHPEERLELIKGEIIKMSPIGAKHPSMVNRLANLLIYELHQKAIVSVQNSIILNNYSEPQPDLVLLKPKADFYENQTPQPEDIYLLIEVSDSSLKYDQEIKIPLYAENKINEVWLVNLNNNSLEVYRHPENNKYKSYEKLNSQKTIFPLAFPELIINLATIFG